MGGPESYKFSSAIQPDFFDVKVGAKYLCIKVKTLYEWVHQRRIPFRKHGSRLVFKQSDLVSWSDQNRVEVVEGAVYKCAR